jgi:hypothetical protein
VMADLFGAWCGWLRYLSLVHNLNIIEHVLEVHEVGSRISNSSDFSTTDKKVSLPPPDDF